MSVPWFLSADELNVDDRFVVFTGERVVVRHGEVVWSLEQLAPVMGLVDMLLLIDGDGEGRRIAAHTVASLETLPGVETKSLRGLLFHGGDRCFEFVGKGSQLLHWYHSHRFCGACGEPNAPIGARTVLSGDGAVSAGTGARDAVPSGERAVSADTAVNKPRTSEQPKPPEHHIDETARVLECTACGRHYFPRINPCAIVLVTRGDEVLLARHARYGASGFYSCLAGFVEVGETPEETVRREVYEEVAVKVSKVRYHQSQSWPFPSQLMLGFIADYAEGEIKPDRREISDAGWFHVNALPQVPSAEISVAGVLIRDYAASVTGR